MSHTIHLVPVGISLLDNLRTHRYVASQHAKTMRLWLENLFDDRQPVHVPSALSTIQSRHDLDGWADVEEILSDASAFTYSYTLSAELSSLCAVKSGMLKPDDCVILLASQTHSGLRAAVGVAEILSHHHAYFGWTTSHWQTPAPTDPHQLDQALSPGAGTLLVTDGLTMRPNASFTTPRRAIGRLTALILATLAAPQSASGVVLHLNGGFKAMLPSLVTASAFLLGLHTVTERDNHSPRISGVVVPAQDAKPDGNPPTPEALPLPLSKAVPPQGLVKALINTDLDEIIRITNGLRDDEEHNAELLGLIDTLYPATGQHRPPSPWANALRRKPDPHLDPSDR